MERRPRARRTARARRVKRPPTPKPASTPWPNIEAFFEAGEGDISLGSIGYNPTLRHTAIASDENNMLVALVRRPGETLHQLLDRLEQALGPAIEDQVFVDEINGPVPLPRSQYGAEQTLTRSPEVVPWLCRDDSPSRRRDSLALQIKN